jgi:D-3-phosphoglycerate dehydrogenase
MISLNSRFSLSHRDAMSQSQTIAERLSLPKDRIKILLLEGIHDTAVALFEQDGYTNVTRMKGALEGEALADALRGVHILGIRSRTQLTEEAFAAADRLMTVGCFCIGTNQVDLNAARHIGVPVFNAPYSNTRSVAELTIGEIIMLLRGIPDKSAAAHRGVWDKSSAGSTEVRGKVLGIVGYGNIGSQLSVLAEAMGMRVIYFDTAAKLPHGNAHKMPTLEALLAEADVVTLHVPETADTAGMIGERELALMKPSAILINNARGTVLDVDAVAEAVRGKRLGGAAVDVFPYEPGSNNERFVTPLQNLPNVILTPHIGGSTAEAQARIGEEVARKLIDYSDVGNTVGAVNFPEVTLPRRPTGTRYMHVHRNVPGLLFRVNDVFSKRGQNIAAEYLQTAGDLGYVVVDADGPADEESVLDDLRQIEGTIRARLLY